MTTASWAAVGCGAAETTRGASRPESAANRTANVPMKTGAATDMTRDLQRSTRTAFSRPGRHACRARCGRNPTVVRVADSEKRDDMDYDKLYTAGTDWLTHDLIVSVNNEAGRTASMTGSHVQQDGSWEPRTGQQGSHP